MDHKKIYRSEAERYDSLVSAEDYQGNLLTTLKQVCLLEGISVVEMGTGTGRLTRLIAPFTCQIAAFDISPAMLAVASRRLQDAQAEVQFGVADHRELPVKSHSADLVLAGWSIGHFVGWYPQNWREQINRVLNEMLRVVKRNGHVIIIETMGTGHSKPNPPTPGLAAYYRLLEEDWGFEYRWIRTDYAFKSEAEANDLLKFFFGQPYDYQYDKSNQVMLPECTGIWSRRISS